MFLKAETSRTKRFVITKAKLTIYNNKNAFQLNANHPPSGHVQGGLCTVRFNLKNFEHVQGEQDPVQRGGAKALHRRRPGPCIGGLGQGFVWWEPPNP